MFNENSICCKGRDCQKTNEDVDAYVELRHDNYGIPTGYYCDDCYENNYPYRRDAYYDYLNAGEYLDEDY
jgi:hypothetical protein